MKISDFPLLSSELVQLTGDDLTGGWQDGQVVQVQALDDDYLIRQDDWVCRATVKDNRSKIALQVQRGLTVWVLRHHRGKILHLQWLELVEHLQLDLSITVDEAITEYLADKGEIATADINKAIHWLNEHFIAEDGLPAASPKVPGQVFLGRFDKEANDSFELFGDRWRGTVRRYKGALKLMRVTALQGFTGQLAMAAGKIVFQDASVATQRQSEEQQALLEAALRDNGSYLRLWQEYGALEWEQAQDCARQLGSLRFQQVSLMEDERRAWFLQADADQVKNFRDRWRALEMSASTQVELGERELDLDTAFEDSLTSGGNDQRRPVRGTLEFRGNGVILVPPQDRRTERPPAKGYLYYSLSGDAAIRKRRERAKQSIKSGRRLPQLSYLLEGVAPPSARHRQLKGLSPYAKACFKGPPTERQERALEVAINTPDLALIVGPPGTGKTQVIAALQRRLVETRGGNLLQHQVLITSYQHDAVDNALNRAEVFGLPAVRIGGRSRSNEGGVDPVKVWCERKRAKISAGLEAVQAREPLTQPLADLRRRIMGLRLARLSPAEQYAQFEQIDALLQQLARLSVRLPPKIRDQWDEFLKRQRKAGAPLKSRQPARLLRLVRALRTTPTGFSDDGADRIDQLRRTLERANVPLQEAECSLLQRLALTREATAADLAELADFKGAMLDRLIPDYRPPVLKQALTREAVELLNYIEYSIEAPLRQSRRGIASVVATYHAALAQDPQQAERTVREYASIVGATCQQAASQHMSNLKELSDAEKTEEIEFDTVVIDEAARANPLDLFVPMAMARRRIVLVGDHRQLPHLVQRDLEEELIERQSLSEAQAKAYEQSLFERLVRQLREQEKVDNIQRVVMLDTQYRMHPTLGDFISQQFYESERLDKLRSGRPAADFAHTIPGYENRCAAWLEVPLSEGKESRRGPSHIRQAEADVIAREVKRIADACGPSLSIGVISFYRAQSDRILETFRSGGLAEDEEGEIRIARPYQQTDSGEERLRVGTVDAFQGKEFDVVFLSIVRANDNVITEQHEPVDRERLLNKKYGHLRVANRLNVAMSRQRKLLIAVGDPRMAQGALAKEAVPALAAFLELCRKEQAHGG
ncbi:hypothetical protein BN873_p40021 [Candidatus Competibacter denitrificans Run_A_D11]|jgi:DNA polymerase III delta prime subunit|uniref:AAA+ ATPase domain-containing protein n=1 Tax=Candidatus Competibacter denitrificans Run_A_D11 TaxID=1400863 RepID=W6M9L8_9GAMM|nr:ATP-binding protein [Candidatus Competibacter denitrificans]CDI04716.1 hypothetical protein BN873_p40021 [Candidatus Competibacter denitrificans Run_A_D11]